MSDQLLGRVEILEAFNALSEELERSGTKGELFVVGGAAVALAYNARRTTREVDAVFEPKAVIYKAARAVATQLALPDHWLNDAAKAYAPGNDKRLAYKSDWLEVNTGSAEYLLAMKLLASRVDRDVDDIRTLYEILGFTTADQGLDLLERLYPRTAIARSQFLLEELFGPAVVHHARLEGRGTLEG